MMGELHFVYPQTATVLLFKELFMLNDVIIL